MRRTLNYVIDLLLTFKSCLMKFKNDICNHLQLVHLEYKLYKALENRRATRKGCYNLRKAFITVGTYKYFINIIRKI